MIVTLRTEGIRTLEPIRASLGGDKPTDSRLTTAAPHPPSCAARSSASNAMASPRPTRGS